MKSLFTERMNLIEKPLFVFDVETENLNLHYKNRPWEIAAKICNYGKIVKEHQALIKWDDFSISVGARRATQFDDARYEAFAKSKELVWNQFKMYFDNKDMYICGHNILGFDLFVINNWLREMGKPELKFKDIMHRVIDTNCLAKMINNNDVEFNFKDLPQKMMQYASFYEKGRKTNLTFLSKHYKIPVDENKTHQAGYDTELNFMVMCEQLKEFKITI